MQDQGAGGGVESRLPSHDRTQSESDARPTEAAPKARSVSPDPDEEDQLGQQNPRGGLDVDGANTPTPPVEQDISAVPTPLCNGNNASLSSTLLARSLEPPVTKATLSELDVHKIIHNPKLRHDINFDPELHFRPNLDGEKGRKKQEKSNQFWALLLEQLHQFATNRDEFYSRYRPDEWCLPSLLKAVKEIIQTLVPQRDRELVDEGLNIELLMQQFNRGIADLERLASWLSKLLKSHCAPMRDDWVDEMYNELSNGNRTNDMDELVKGMRSLLSVLEAMKLDVANHQIRCLRPVLIEDTVHFERGFFIRKVQTNKMCLDPARAWYRDAMDFAESATSAGLPSGARAIQSFGETAVFFDALSRIILPSTFREHIPMHVMFFDEERILKLRSDLYDSICLEICMRKFEELDRLSGTSELLMRYGSGPLASEEMNRYSTSSSDLDFYCTAPQSSRPSSLALSDRESDHFSPRSSPRSSSLLSVPACSGFRSGSPSDSDSHSRANDPEYRARASALYTSLLALLHTAAPAQDLELRWRSLVESMAVQIMRFIDVPSGVGSVVLNFEDQLLACVLHIGGELFQRVEIDLHERLLAELAKRVKEYRNLSGIGIFSAATGGRIHGPSRTWDGGRERGVDARELADRVGIAAAAASEDLREDAGIADMATRLAHLGMLHWRVWAPLAYVDDNISNDDVGDVPMQGL